MNVAVHYAARSDLGLGPKSRNEDSAYAGPHLLVLADGMGGHAAGDVASSMIVGVLAPLDEDVPAADQALDMLDAALHEANERLTLAMRENPDLMGMGSTTIALLRTGNKIAMAHIGDSRAYLLRDGKLAQITKDHSFVQALLDDGRITPDEAEHHPQRFLVTRVMTGMPDDEPDLSVREAVPGDRYLLCSDGLSDYVRETAIAEILGEAGTPEEAADRLIAVALKSSTRDNVTVVVADIVDLDAVDAPSTVPVIVGAAAAHARTRGNTRGIPVSPAEKAAALSREATATDAPTEAATDQPEAPTLAETTRTRRWGRRAFLVAGAAAIVLTGFLGYQWTQRQFYVGVDDGKVAIYQGVPQAIGPWSLSHVQERSDVLVSDLPATSQDAVGKPLQVSDRAEADAKVELLRDQAIACRLSISVGMPCPGTSQPAPTSTSTSASSSSTSSTTSPATTSPGTRPATTPVTTPGTPGATKPGGPGTSKPAANSVVVRR